MRRILITGGAGFIGSNFTNYWTKKYSDDHIVVIDALTYAGHRMHLNSLEKENKIIFVHGNICDYELVSSILIDEQIDTIVHFAAESHVDRSINSPAVFMETNVLGTHTLLRAARELWLESGKNFEHHLFHHVSTDEVYGSLGFDDLKTPENSRYKPNSPYAASKAASDHIVRSYQKTYGLRATISNGSNTYGPRQFPEKLIPSTIIKALMNQSIPIYGDGTNIRDWIYVEDHCRGIESIILSGFVGQNFNIGGNIELNNNEIVDQICMQMDKIFVSNPDLIFEFPDAPAANKISSSSLVNFVNDRLGHDLRYGMDLTKIRQDIGFIPKTSLTVGLSLTIEWMIRNKNWWQPIL